MSTQTGPATGSARQIDPRGPRFGAAVTTIVLAVVLVLLPRPVAVVLLALQAVAFGLGAFAGLSAQPYGWLYRVLVRPRLSPPAELEDERPPRFAQLVGFLFVAVALVALVFGATLVAQIAVAFALAAAFLNAVFAFCLGCEMYLLWKRVATR